MANKRSAASSRGRDLFRAEVSSLLADLGELAGEPGPHPVPATTPPVADEPAAQAREAVLPGPAADADVAPAPGPDGEADEAPSPPERDDAPDEELISLSPSYLPPLPPVVAPLTAAPEPAAPFGSGFSASEPAPPPGPWAAAPEPEAPPELWPEMAPASDRTSPPGPEASAPWPSPPDPVALSGGWPPPSEPAATPGGRGAPPEPPAAPEEWRAPPEPPAAPEQRASPAEPPMVAELWPFMSDLSTAAGGWDEWPERSAAPDPPTFPPQPADAAEQWVSPPAHEPPATGQGWPPPPESADAVPPPEGGWTLPPGLPMEWPSTAVGAAEEGVPGPAVPPASHHHPAPLPPIWPSPAEPPPVAAGDDLAWMPAPPAPPPAPEAGEPGRGAPEIAGGKLPTDDIAAAETAAEDQSARAWARAASSQPSRFPTLAELPGWRLDGPVRGAAAVPGLTGGTGTDGAQRFRTAPPSQPLAGGGDDGPALDQAPQSIPGLASETAIAGGPPVDDSGPAPEGSGERTPPAPPTRPTPIPATAEASAAPGPATTSSGPAAAGRPGLPLLPGGQAALVSTRPWTLAAAMQPLAPMAPPALRAGTSLPEPAGPVLSRSRSSGVNVPFAAVVTALVVVLVALVVLIFLDLHH